MKKLAIIISHPIPYYTPVFELLARETELCVFYTLGPEKQYDSGFDTYVEWDIPLLDHYPYRFLENKAFKPGSAHFMGIYNPTAIETLTAYQPDYLLVYGWAHYSHLQIMCHFKGKVPIFFRGDSTLQQHTSWLKKHIRYLFLSWVYRHVDLALYVGSNNKKYYQKFGLTQAQLIFAPHAVDNKRFSAAADHTAIRKELGINQTDLLILYAGKLISQKGIELLIEGFLLAQIPGAHLLIVGAGPLEIALKTTHIRNKHIHFLPFQNQQKMPWIYQSCDLFCLPSTNDTWGLSVNEAMAAGKALLISDQAGAAADLVSPFNGLVFKSGDLADFTQKLSSLCSCRHQLKLLGDFSQQNISYWSFDIQVKNITNALTYGSNA